jgi:hypothetical protein
MTDIEKDNKIRVNLISELSNLSVRGLIKKETYVKYSEWLKQLKTNAEIEEDLELAYKNQDEVVYNRGYDQGREDERKEKIIISDEDIERLVCEYQYDGHPCDFQVLAYRQGIERVVKFIKGENHEQCV